MVGETLQKLTNGIAALDKELYSQVVTNYEDLLSQAGGVEALESKSSSLNSFVNALLFILSFTLSLPLSLFFRCSQNDADTNWLTKNGCRQN